MTPDSVVQKFLNIRPAGPETGRRRAGRTGIGRGRTGRHRRSGTVDPMADGRDRREGAGVVDRQLPGRRGWDRRGRRRPARQLPVSCPVLPMAGGRPARRPDGPPGGRGRGLAAPDHAPGNPGSGFGADVLGVKIFDKRRLTTFVRPSYKDDAMKTLSQLRNHPAVQEIILESDFGRRTYWINLKPGFATDFGNGQQSGSESTVKGIESFLEDVRPIKK